MIYTMSIHIAIKKLYVIDTDLDRYRYILPPMIRQYHETHRIGKGKK